MPATPWWWRAGLLLVVGVAVATRVAFALALAPDLPTPGDATLYRGTAQHLADGDGFVYDAPGGGPPQPSAEHTPLFPILLAGADLVGLDTTREHGVALAVLSGVGVAVVAQVGRRVGGPVAGLLAAALAAVHPMWTQPAGLVLSESLYLVTVPLVLLAALDLRDRRTTMAAVPLGIAIGAAGLTRPEGLGLLAVVAAPAVLLGSVRSPAAWRAFGLVALVTVLTVTPWVVRNRVDLDAWVLSTNGGKTLLGSNCGDTYAGDALGGFSYDCQFGAAALLVQQGPPEGEWWDSRAFDDELGEMGRRFIDDHRGEVPKVVAARVARMWGLAFATDQRRFDVDEGRHPGLQHLGQWVHLVVLTAAVVGSLLLLRSRARRAAGIVLLGPIVLVTATCVLIYGGTRMRTGAEASLAVLAAVAAVSITRSPTPRR
jgi:hypothetical protein